MEALYANTAAIPTSFGGGGGCNGHIGLLMDAAVYEDMATTRYTRPIYTVPYVQHGPGDTVVVQDYDNDIQKEDRRVYYIDENADAALKQEIIAEVEETYLSAKNQRLMGFHDVSTNGLVDHLMERYGKICASDLEACRKALEESIELDRPIDVYSQWAEEAIQLSQDGKMTLTPVQIFQTAYHAINKTGLYSLALKEWHKKSPADQTWTIFKQVIAEEYQNLAEETKVTSRDSGFHSENAMQEIGGAL